ncbi:MAG: hypothetical protein ACYSWP_12415 [Planctomycetota bacterium]|jgi:ABC-type transport system involved in multi-copper enzyme maturation permease subunit
MIKSLIWKEWHEQRWKLAFGTVMLVFFAGSLLAARLTAQSESIIVVWILGGLVLSLYSAMGVFAPEMTNGTKTFLSSKPLQPWKVFLCKWFFGWLNFAVPMVVCSTALAIMILLNPQGRFFEISFIAKGTIAGVCLGTVFYSMTCCFAPRKSSEALVGFTGCIILVVFMLHIAVNQIFVFRLDSLWTDYTLSQEFFLYINPAFWVDSIRPLSSDMHHSILFFEQGVLFAITIWIGFRKWQRSS